MDWLVLLDEHGNRVLAAQHVPTLAQPTRPSHDVPKQPHMDVRTPTVDEVHRHHQPAQPLGPSVLLDCTDDPHEPRYVLADPAGHPCCLLVAAQ